MTNFPESLIKIIRALQSLPEIGPKMAQRISFHILNWKKEDVMTQKEKKTKSV